MLYLSAIILSVFLSFVLITKRNKTSADYLLVTWLFTIGFNLFCYYLFLKNQFINFPSIIVFGFSIPLAHGPFLYLYTRNQTSHFPFAKTQLLHFLPLFLSVMLFLDFHLLPYDQKADVIINKGQGYESRLLINMYFVFFSGIIYVLLSLFRLLKYRKNLVYQFSNIEKINFNWLLYLIIWMMLIWLIVLFTRNDKLIYGSVSLFVIWIGYFGVKQVQVFSQINDQQKNRTALSDNNLVPKSNISKAENISINDSPVEDEDFVNQKYQKSSLTNQDVTDIYDRLKLLMYEKKPFTNPDLTLNELAQSLDIHPNYLSQVINSKEHKNFYDLVNERRVEEFKKLVSQSSNQKYTLMAIAYDSGFNSKASFNRNFKKYTGLTPTDYLQKQVEK